MKIFDPTAIVPYQIPELEDAFALVDDRNRRRANTPQSMPPMSPADEKRYLATVAKDRADDAWLRSNTPMGTVFDVLGVSHMVVSFPYRVDTPDRPGPGPLQIHTFAPDGRGGIDRSLFTCTQLRAMLEPGFVCP